ALRGFQPPESGLPGLGPLERRVLDVVWRLRRATVREVQGALDGTSAYTTVMTVLDRLYKKGILERVRQGRAFVYSAAASSDQLQSSMAMGLLGRLLGRGSKAAAPILSSLVDTVGARDRRLLDDLDRLVQEKRRKLREGR
ncbi:MAG TPA: BlaI/MecI/CopY family transcriptional regulator, partial [Vicinamibacteria bacterium]|nr:BlaI/MecI/CopY family transcriptional regulator [Vicinamibacteria bacterium]